MLSTTSWWRYPSPYCGGWKGVPLSPWAGARGERVSVAMFSTGTKSYFTFTLTALTASVSFAACGWIVASCSPNGSRPYRTIKLFAFLGFAEDQPVAVMASGVVRFLPAWINDWTLANLHDAVAGREPDHFG